MTVNGDVKPKVLSGIGLASGTLPLAPLADADGYAYISSKHPDGTYTQHFGK